MRPSPPPLQPACLLLLAVLLEACSPSLNWREVRAEPAALSVLLPCKPDRGSRTVAFAGRPTAMHMVGCDAAGMTFAVASAELADPTKAAAVLAQWQAATLAHLHGSPAAPTRPATVHGASSSAGAVPPVRADISGRRPDGEPVRSQALYFANGAHVFQAAIYGSRIPPEAADTFFEGLKFQ